MTQRVALLNGNNINQDFDLSKIFEAFSESWVVKWLEVQAWNVTPWFAFVEVQREWKKFCILFENTENFSIDTSWNKKIFIEISENNILNWTINSEDWTWIWIIKSADYFPSKNFLALAEITNWQIRDTRVFVRIRDSVAWIENITSNLVRKSIKINPWEDLNNIKTPWFYYNGANVESDQILNHPNKQFGSKLQHMNDSAFGLLVYEASWVIQELTIFNTTYKFIRRFYDNNWSPWYVMWIRPNWTMNEKSHFLAIWDDDTWIAQESDWVLWIYANNLKVAEIQQAWIYSNRPQANSGNSLVRKDYVDNRFDNIFPKVVFASQNNINNNQTWIEHTVSWLNEETLNNWKYSIEIITTVWKNLIMLNWRVTPIVISWRNTTVQYEASIMPNKVSYHFWNSWVTSMVKKILIIQNY